VTRLRQSEYENLADFRYALRQFLLFSAEAAKSAGLTAQQHQAMLMVKGSHTGGRITISELAARLQIRHHSAVGLVNRLAAQGLLVREPSRQDRRQVFIRLSARGTRVLEGLSAAHKEELKRIGPQLRSLLRGLAHAGRG
jgi:DNA-binding MarR family transcriptional regulator